MTKYREEVSHEKVKSLLFYDPEKGHFIWRISPRHTVPAGSGANRSRNVDGYESVTIDFVAYKAHRLAWFYVYGEWPNGDIDHINGIRHDNRIVNLRVVKRGDNVMNSRKRAGKYTSKYRGVSFHKKTGKWSAAFRGKYLGIRETPEEAHELYLAKFKEFEYGLKMPLHPAHQPPPVMTE